MEYTLDPVAVFVGFEVAGRWINTVGARLNDWQDRLHQQGAAKLIAIESLVGQHHSGFCDRQGQYDDQVDALTQFVERIHSRQGAGLVECTPRYRPASSHKTKTIDTIDDGGACTPRCDIDPVPTCSNAHWL